MGKTHDGIDAAVADFIRAQRMFFVATAPAEGGHINLSPKGLDTFRILDPHTVAYLDLTGSGIETVAHLRENRRIVIMFCAFDGAPNILRLHGRGDVLEAGHGDFAALLAQFPPIAGVRTIIRVTVERVSDSCGYGVPLYRYEGERPQLVDWARRKGLDGLRRYQTDKNASSLDGLPGMRRAD